MLRGRSGGADGGGRSGEREAKCPPSRAASRRGVPCPSICRASASSIRRRRPARVVEASCVLQVRSDGLEDSLGQVQIESPIRRHTHQPLVSSIEGPKENLAAIFPCP